MALLHTQQLVVHHVEAWSRAWWLAWSSIHGVEMYILLLSACGRDEASGSGLAAHAPSQQVNLQLH